MKSKRQMSGRLLAILLALVMTVCALQLVTVAAYNESVNNVRNGVLQVNVSYRDETGSEIVLQTGTGFLINENNFLTCAHVVNILEEDVEWLAEYFGVSANSFRDRIVYSVTVNRDVTVGATIVTKSDEVDWCVMKLAQPLNTYSPLPIRSSEEVQLTETVHAVGFPAWSSYSQDIPTYTKDDVTITSGSVNKKAQGVVSETGTVPYKYIQTSVQLSAGISGGPLVDDEGNVVGVCQSGAIDGSYFYAIASDEITPTLDTLGIAYTPAGTAPVADVAAPALSEPAEEPALIAPAPADKGMLGSLIAEMDALEADDYTEDSFNGLLGALDSAKSVNNKSDATQAEVDAAVDALRAAKTGLEEKSGLSVVTIALIVVAVLIVAGVVVLLIVLLGKKKAPETKPNTFSAAGTGTMPVAPAPAPAPAFNPAQPQPFAPAAPRPANFAAPQPNPAPMGGAGETTVLSGAGETSILTRKIDGGLLINAKTGERASVNTESFIVGRERTKVNFCLNDTNVSRMHAKIVNRGGAAFLVDLNATNGTFLNGAKCMPNVEMPLKSGDKILLGDTELTFQK